jgi:membrane-associated phospholipid phosphatase
VRAGATIVLALVVARAAHADDHVSRPDPAWLVDGGAIPLFWMPLGVQLSLGQWSSPRSTPLLFDPNEGGATRAPWEIPNWPLYVAGIGTAGAMVLGHDPARWYHAKGLAESMATSGMVMAVMKDVFGRHRPDWTATSTDLTKDQSFPSGHATEVFAIATYSALYLHDHVFDGGGLTVGRGLAYGGLFTAATLVAAERVLHHRHFVSDVVVGSVLGAATSALIYRYQQHRATGERVRDLVLAPTLDGRGTVFSIGGKF